MTRSSIAPPPRPRLSLPLLVLCALAAPPALAQEPPPPEDPEIRALREAAEEELLESELGPGPVALDETDRLRRLAELETEDQSPQYSQLLESFHSLANRLNAFNPRITVFGDVLGRVSASSAELVEDGQNRDDRIALREVELDLRADIDPYAKGVLILAFEEHEIGEYEATVEEGYLTLETLPLGLRAQIGRFRVPFGQINKLHVHDLPQSTRPYALTDFFGEEGYIEHGALLSWLTPWIPLELTVGLLNGESEAIFAGVDSDDPAWLGRVDYFQSLTDTAYLSLGGSYLFGYNDAPNPVNRPGKPSLETHVWGADVLFRWQQGVFRSVVAQGELYHLRRETGGKDREYGFGAFGLVQVQPFQRWYIGARYDWSNFAEGTEDGEQWAIGGWISYYTTEFLRFRLGYEHREIEGEDDLDTVYFQLTFVFGSHPVEPYWFNR